MYVGFCSAGSGLKFLAGPRLQRSCLAGQRSPGDSDPELAEDPAVWQMFCKKRVRKRTCKTLFHDSRSILGFMAFCFSAEGGSKQGTKEAAAHLRYILRPLSHQFSFPLTIPWELLDATGSHHGHITLPFTLRKGIRDRKLRRGKVCYSGGNRRRHNKSSWGHGPREPPVTSPGEEVITFCFPAGNRCAATLCLRAGFKLSLQAKS